MSPLAWSRRILFWIDMRRGLHSLKSSTDQLLCINTLGRDIYLIQKQESWVPVKQCRLMSPRIYYADLDSSERGATLSTRPFFIQRRCGFGCLEQFHTNLSRKVPSERLWQCPQTDVESPNHKLLHTLALWVVSCIMDLINASGKRTLTIRNLRGCQRKAWRPNGVTGTIRKWDSEIGAGKWQSEHRCALFSSPRLLSIGRKETSPICRKLIMFYSKLYFLIGW